MQQHTLIALVQDRPGVLHRTVSLFRRRGFNIASLAVGASETPGASRMTLVVDAEEVEQVVKQLYRLVEVIKVTDVTHEDTVQREMALLKVSATSTQRPAVMALAHALEARVVDVDAHTMIVELTGTPQKVDKLVALMQPFGLRELMRSGRIVMMRGAHLSRARRTNGAHTGSGAHAGNGAGPAYPVSEATDEGAWSTQADGAA